ncbi:helix-turn-helix protein [Laceyella sacchari]|jgi:transcriptional regulator with XRE-family HTH domain|uniref:helix-turn-helix domain-containing protein n=1 Tax=Laceyella sacchari TaxID=37482 RepID=UPI000B20645A|nr:helix-turn-helix transcriptional regulator [Laceyella sacchari]TCW35312.1 helix-turn-helix protein [Laceyella sacchari]
MSYQHDRIPNIEMILLKRKQKGLPHSVDWLATELGVSRSVVYMWIKGEKHPKATNMFHLADLLDCTLDELYPKKADIIK